MLYKSLYTGKSEKNTILPSRYNFLFLFSLFLFISGCVNSISSNQNSLNCKNCPQHANNNSEKILLYDSSLSSDSNAKRKFRFEHEYKRKTPTSELVAFLSMFEPIAGPEASDTSSKPALDDSKPKSESANKEISIPKQNGIATINKLRIGEHKGFTRIVIESSEKISPEIGKLDKQNMMAINIPDSAWHADNKKFFPNKPLLVAYLAEQSANDKNLTRLVFKFKKPVKTETGYIRATDSYKNHRLIIDVKPR